MLRCQFSGSSAYHGGAIGGLNAVFLVSSVVITRGFARYQGGAIYVAHAQLVALGLTVQHTVALGEGGAVYGTAAGGALDSIRVSSTWALEGGGALGCSSIDQLQVSRARFMENVAGKGGALKLSACNLQLLDVEIGNSTAYTAGGGMYAASRSRVMARGLHIHDAKARQGAGMALTGVAGGDFGSFAASRNNLVAEDPMSFSEFALTTYEGLVR